jgi:hypothetical protein
VPRADRGYGTELYGIAGTAPDDVWIVGDADQGAHWVGVIEHWDGHKWRVIASPRVGEYTTVTAISRNDAWAAGSRTLGYDRVFRPAHWNGRSWSLVEDASKTMLAGASDSSASGARNVWIVGGNWGEPGTPFVERFNGNRFALIPVPFRHWRENYKRNRDSDVLGVAAISPRSVWAVGSFGIEHYDGRHWRRISHDSSYRAIDATAPTDIWAVGGRKAAHFSCR